MKKFNHKNIKHFGLLNTNKFQYKKCKINAWIFLFKRKKKSEKNISPGF